MKKTTISLLLALWAGIATGQGEIVINPDTAYAEADATAAQTEAVSSIYNASGFELNVYWQRDSTVLPAGWSVDFCEKNGCFPASAMDTIFTLFVKENAPLSAVFRPNGIPGTGWMRVRLYSGSSGIHFDKDVVFMATATGETAVGEPRDGSMAVALYPNPAIDFIKVETAAGTIAARWQITAADGRAVSSGQAPVESVDVGQLLPGPYFFQLLSAENRIVATVSFLKK